MPTHFTVVIVQVVISPKANSYTQLPVEGEADDSPTLVLATQVNTTAYAVHVVHCSMPNDFHRAATHNMVSRAHMCRASLAEWSDGSTTGSGRQLPAC